VKRFEGNPGDTVWFHEMHQDIPHIYVVITPPEGESSRAIVVNLTSQRSGSDHTVVLDRGDHPFIKCPTVVNYQAARIVSVNWLRKEIEQGFAWADHPFDPHQLKRIQRGVLNSPLVPHDIKQYFLRTMGLPSSKDD
jgi:hypothetical protein